MSKQSPNRVGVIRWKLRDVIVSAVIVMAASGALHMWAKQQVFPNYTIQLLWQMTLCVMMVVVPMAVIFGLRRQNATEISWKSKSLRKDVAFALIMAAALLLLVASFGILYCGKAYGDWRISYRHELGFYQMMSLPVLLLFLLYFGLVGPVSEEIFWRGFVYQGLRKKMPLVPALVCQALAFAVYHFSSVMELVPVFLVGLGLGYAFQKKRSLVTPMCIHMCLNLISVGILVVGIQSTGGVGSMRWAVEDLRKFHPELPDDRATRDRLKQLLQLGRLRGEERTRRIASYLGDSEEGVRILAAAMLHAFYKTGDPAIGGALRSLDWKVVDGALTVVGVTRDKSFIPDIAVLTDHDKKRIRLGAVFALSEMDAVPELITALQNSKEDVCRLVIRLLKRRTNRDFGYKPDDSPEERLTATRRWQEWWEENKDSFGKEK